MQVHTVTTIICRACQAELPVAAETCARCGARTDDPSASPTSPTSPATAAMPAAPQDALLNRPWFLVVLLLHVGILGIPAYWATKYSVTTRLLIIAASIVYTLLAVAIIVWAVQQILALL